MRSTYADPSREARGPTVVRRTRASLPKGTMVGGASSHELAVSTHGRTRCAVGKHEPEAMPSPALHDPTNSGNRRGRLLLAFPAVCALFDVGVELYLSTYGMLQPGYWRNLSAVDRAELFDQVTFGLGTLAWSLTAPLALTVLVVVGLRRFPRGLAAVAAACLTFTIATFAALISMLLDGGPAPALLPERPASSLRHCDGSRPSRTNSPSRQAGVYVLAGRFVSRPTYKRRSLPQSDRLTGTLGRAAGVSLDEYRIAGQVGLFVGNGEGRLRCLAT